MANPKLGRPAKWSGPTRAIRVPEHLADHLLDIARELDSSQAPEPSTTPAGLPICKPKADAETIAQGLAEGWIVATQPKGPQLLTVEAKGKVEQYLVDDSGLTPEQSRMINKWVDRVWQLMEESHFGEDERLYILSEMALRHLTPITPS